MRHAIERLRARLPALPWEATPTDLVSVARLVLATGALLAVVGATVQAVIHLTDMLAFDGRSELLNADNDEGVFTWASVAVTFAAAYAAAVLAALVAERRVMLLGLALFLALFSFDDELALHEHISVGAIGPIEHGGRLLWPAVLMPALAVVFVLLLALSERAPEEIRAALRLALALLVLAVALELGSSLLFEVDSGHGEWLYETEVALEEGAELAAWFLIASALGASVVHFATGRSSADAPRS